MPEYKLYKQRQKMSNNAKTSLKLGDRIQIVNVLPIKDSFERLIIREGIIEKTKVTAEDVKNHEIKTENGSIAWTKGELDYLFEFTITEKDYIRDNLKALSDKKELGADALGLYKQFI